jgi:hypothetical protein
MSFVPGIGTVQTCAFHRSDRSNDRGGGNFIWFARGEILEERRKGGI